MHHCLFNQSSIEEHLGCCQSLLLQVVLRQIALCICIFIFLPVYLCIYLSSWVLLPHSSPVSPDPLAWLDPKVTWSLAFSVNTLALSPHAKGSVGGCEIFSVCNWQTMLWVIGKLWLSTGVTICSLLHGFQAGQPNSAWWVHQASLSPGMGNWDKTGI